MKCGVRFCGGCNPRYDRGRALKELEWQLKGKAEFAIAEEHILYDKLLVIGGCTNCCASYSQFKSAGGVLKMWSEGHIQEIAALIGRQAMEAEDSAEAAGRACQRSS